MSTVTELRGHLAAAQAVADQLADRFGDLDDDGKPNASVRCGRDLWGAIQAVLDSEELCHFEDREESSALLRKAVGR